MRLTYEQFVEKSISIHGNGFDYSKSVYLNNNTPLTIKCNICGYEFETTTENHWKGSGCPECGMYAGEHRIAMYLKNKYSYFYEYKFNDCIDKKELSYDFCIPEKNILIEYNGEQYYNYNVFGRSRKEFLIQKHHDWLKRKYAIKNGYNLIVIPYWQFKDIEKNLLS